MNIEEFYEQDERRRASTEVELGRDWYDANDLRHELSWVADTGELYLMSEPAVALYEDPLGDYSVDDENVDNLVVRVVAEISTHERVEEILNGWADAMAKPKGVEWLIDRLSGAGVLLEPDA